MCWQNSAYRIQAYGCGQDFYVQYHGTIPDMQRWNTLRFCMYGFGQPYVSVCLYVSNILSVVTAVCYDMLIQYAI